eukprot:2390943-Amphidinium_carterae.1
MASPPNLDAQPDEPQTQSAEIVKTSLYPLRPKSPPKTSQDQPQVQTPAQPATSEGRASVASAAASDSDVFRQVVSFTRTAVYWPNRMKSTYEEYKSRSGGGLPPHW